MRDSAQFFDGSSHLRVLKRGETSSSQGTDLVGCSCRMSSPERSVDLFFHVRLIFGLPSRLAASVALLSSGRIRLPLPEQIDLNSRFRRARVGADGGEDRVYLNESLLVILVVVCCRLAGRQNRGGLARLIGDIAMASIGDWLLPQIGIHLGTGIVSAIVNATIGAVLLLLVVRLLQGGGRFGGFGRRRWW